MVETTSKRVLNIILGALIVTIAIVGFFFALEFFWLLMVINSILLIILGIFLIIDRPLKIDQKWELERTSAIILGVFLVIISSIIVVGSIMSPFLAGTLYVYLFAAGIIAVAIYAILWGYKKRKSRWGIGFLVIFLSIFLIILALLIFAAPVLGLAIILILVQIALIIIGLRVIIIGIFPEVQYM